MGKHGAVIQARMGSVRLPGKTLLRVGSVPLIDRVIKYTAEVYSQRDIILATTDLPEDDVLVNYVSNKWGIGIYRGSSSNVRSRFIEVAELNSFETIMRITADDPFKIRSHLEKAREIISRGEIDYYCNFNPYLYPVGLDVEAYRCAALLETLNHETASAIEHVTTDLREKSSFAHYFEQGNPTMVSTRLTIDTAEDLKFCNEIASLYLNKGLPFGNWSDLQLVLAKLDEGALND